MSLKEGDVKTHGEDVTCAPRRDLSALSTSCKGRASIQWKHRSTMLHSGLGLQSEFVVTSHVAKKSAQYLRRSVSQTQSTPKTPLNLKDPMWLHLWPHQMVNVSTSLKNTWEKTDQKQRKP